MKHKIFIVLTIAIFSSCMKLKKKEDDTNLNNSALIQSAQARISDRSELTYTYDLSESSELHAVRFQAPANWPKELVVRKISQETKGEVGIKLNNQNEWSDFITTDKKTTYQFYQKQTTDLVLLTEVEVMPVLDLTVDDDKNLAQDYKLTSKTKMIYFKKLIIAEQKHLYLENFTGQVVINNLETRSGFIQTFPSDSRAPVGEHGKSNGQIQLEIKYGEGQLIVIMKGQNGGNGKPANPPDASLKGASGAPVPMAEFLITPGTPIVISGGLGGSPGTPTTASCSREHGAVSEGFSGHQGFPGNEGKNGGDTGSINIINYSSDLKISLNSLVGSKGLRSSGGEGGEGGDGSPATDGLEKDLDIWLWRINYPRNPVTKQSLDGVKIIKPCLATPAGKKGLPGIQGNPGANDGEDGIMQPSCLYFQNQKVKCINE